MRETPVLLVAYNRPEKLRRLIDALRPVAPQRLLVSLDGPKTNIADVGRVLEVRKVLEEIDWVTPEVLAHETNRGLRSAVGTAVSWAIDRYGETLVIEDDAIPGPDLIPYVSAMLERFRDDESIAHISGYTQVPRSELTQPQQGSRLSRYPGSWAWATWARAWAAYDESLDWGLDAPLDELIAASGSRAAALRWRQNFRDTASGRLDSWAYRWVDSMWSRGWRVLTPNGSLVDYAGLDEGTHVSFLRPGWEVQPIHEGPLEDLLVDSRPELDEGADDYMTKRVFRGSWWGVAFGLAISAGLETRRLLRARRAKRRLPAA